MYCGIAPVCTRFDYNNIPLYDFAVCLALHELDKGKGDTLEDEQPRRADEHDQTLSEEQ